VHLPGTPISQSQSQPAVQQQQQQQQPRPVLKHSQTVAPGVPQQSSAAAAGRLRSESLTMLSSPFGASVFSTNWSRNLSSGGGGGFSPVEESSDIADQDEIDSATLNYLGLAEHARPVPATLSELRSQAQALLVPQRSRAKTVSGGAFLPNSLSRGGLGSLPTQEADEDEYGVDMYDEPAYAPSAQAQALIARGFKPSVHLAAPTSRPRATSVGDLERLTRRPDAFAVENDYLSYAPVAPPGLSKSFTVGRPSPTVRFPPGGELLRSMSAGNTKLDSPAQVQTPSRSLWIGNLDSSMTSEALIHVFAPYGAIESLRLLPEKVRVSLVPRSDPIFA